MLKVISSKAVHLPLKFHATKQFVCKKGKYYWPKMIYRLAL